MIEEAFNKIRGLITDKNRDKIIEDLYVIIDHYLYESLVVNNLTDEECLEKFKKDYPKNHIEK